MKALAVLAAGLLIAGNIITNRSKLLAAESAPARGHAGMAAAPPSPAALGIEFVKDSTSTLVMERGGRRYIVDLVARTVEEAGPNVAPVSGREATSSGFRAPSADGAKIFQHNCAQCHGAGGRGIAAMKTPNFTDPKLQASLTEDQVVTTIKKGRPGTAMPAWADKLSDEEIKAVAGYVRSLAGPTHPGGAAPTRAAETKVYTPGDDVLLTLPTGRRLDRHGFYVNFAHRFAFDPAFSGTARGGGLAGLDGFAIPSFGFRYGFTKKLSGSIFRAPSIIGRPIELTAAYNFTDERDGYPLNVAFRASIQGQNSFLKEYTENLEGIFSRSLTRRAQIYIVPTLSINDRRLNFVGTFRSRDIPNVPGHNTFSLGIGGALDVRPTVALVAEVIPTLVNGRELNIHRPVYGFGIQKKIFRHSFTFGFTNGPGTTISQRAGTRASFLNNPAADKPQGLFIGFDLTRQIY
jgi:mono/diheme cytochrome c family protein